MGKKELYKEIKYCAIDMVEEDEYNREKLEHYTNIANSEYMVEDLEISNLLDRVEDEIGI